VGLATHLGPWLIGTVKNTTGSTAGTVRNVGATIVAQNKTITAPSPANTVAFALPAGAMIISFLLYTTGVYNSATSIVLSINGTPITSSLTITAQGSYTLTYVVSAAVLNLLSNVGSTDALVTYTLTGSATGGTSYLTINYVVRNADGTYVPNSVTGP
jgi:hypothetical protein